MVTGSWDPQQGVAPQKADIDPQWLRRFIEWADTGRLDELPGLIDDHHRHVLGRWMQADPTDWERTASSFSDEQLIALIRFLTVAEMKIPGWRCDEKSPAIAIAGLLKQRGRRLDRDLLRWIRNNSDNRYIPHGPVL